MRSENGDDPAALLLASEVGNVPVISVMSPPERVPARDGEV
jgi:hypothetical protein